MSTGVLHVGLTWCSVFPFCSLLFDIPSVWCVSVVSLAFHGKNHKSELTPTGAQLKHPDSPESAKQLAKTTNKWRQRRNMKIEPPISISVICLALCSLLVPGGPSIDFQTTISPSLTCLFLSFSIYFCVRLVGVCRIGACFHDQVVLSMESRTPFHRSDTARAKVSMPGAVRWIGFATAIGPVRIPSSSRCSPSMERFPVPVSRALPSVSWRSATKRHRPGIDIDIPCASTRLPWFFLFSLLLFPSTFPTHSIRH